MAVVAVAVVAVGIAVYSMTRTTEVPGQKLGEIARQTAKEGEPRQIIYGIVRPIGGNMVAVQEPPRIERRKQKSGGKGGGGGGSTSTVEIPRRTYAIGICEGPVTGIRRAWRNNKLIYDARGTAWGARNNGTFLQRFGFYMGGWDQMPDPSLEAVFGAGNVPAMRGTCYMVARDEDLQDTGGAIPQWIFEVERAYGYGLTSRPYAVVVQDSADVSADLPGIRVAEIHLAGEVGGVDATASLTAIALEEAGTYKGVESIDPGASVSEIFIKELPAIAVMESIDPGALVSSVVLKEVIATTEAESVDPGASVQSIILEAS